MYWTWSLAGSLFANIASPEDHSDHNPEAFLMDVPVGVRNFLSRYKPRRNNSILSVNDLNSKSHITSLFNDIFSTNDFWPISVQILRVDRRDTDDGSVISADARIWKCVLLTIRLHGSLKVSSKRTCKWSLVIAINDFPRIDQCSSDRDINYNEHV